ncbi:MAG: nucleotidyl transferase AbiEii/AbiGii toxin family protein [Gaiellales bacterium]|nr:nucleotidyl transferase AbiEii/AbiGii toxin family protein [Gaiellales bacterium]
MSPDDVRRRLRRRADELGLDFQQAIQYYAIERFLFRLSRSDVAGTLIVKGATMLRVWGSTIARPTRDIDFLGHLDRSPEAVEAVVRSCLAAGVPDDGLTFDDIAITEQIALDGKYPGFRAKLRGTFKGARFVRQLDIGIGDDAVPAPAWVDYPTLLDGPCPRILAYHPATAVAEKFEAIVSLGLVNSRLKDFYDLWLLATTLPFAGRQLRDSIAATFARRETPLPNDIPVGLTDVYAGQETVVSMWSAFARKLQISGVGPPPDLPEVISIIQVFIMPPALAAAVQQDFDAAWSHGNGWL